MWCVINLGLLLNLQIDFFAPNVLYEECIQLQPLEKISKSKSKSHWVMICYLNDFSDAVETETLEDIKGKLVI